MQRLTVGEHRVRGKARVLLRRFESAKVSDKAAEAKIHRLGCTSAVFGLLCFFGLFAAGYAASLDGPALLWALPLLALVLAIVFGLKASMLQKYDLDDDKLDTVVQLLRMLEADTPKEAQLQLEVDFRDYRKGGTLDSKEGGWSKPKVFKYTHEWLSLQGALLDGSSYLVELSEGVTRKEKPKRKYTKVKESFSATIALQMKLKPGLYGDPGRVADTLRRMRPPAYLKLKSLTSRGRTLRIALTLPRSQVVTARGAANKQGERATGDSVLAVFLWAYDGISKTMRGAA